MGKSELKVRTQYKDGNSKHVYVLERPLSLNVVVVASPFVLDCLLFLHLTIE
eukprot:m.273674 g.273674  ORF g.273674 m.273674 type:complete len:52 (+) comp95493_c0_seq1:2-157(+)